MISRRSVILAGLATPLLPAPAFARDSFSEAAFTSAAAAGKTVLIEFHASWCPTCRAQEKVINNLTKQSDFSNVIVLRVLFDTEKELLKRFKVRQQSTLIVFKDGIEVARAVGETGAEAIANLVKKAA